MIEIEQLLFVCAWLILYLILQLCTWLILRPWLSSALALPASFAVSLLYSCLISWYLAWLGFSPTFSLGILLILTGGVLGVVKRARINIISELKEGKGYYALFFLVFLVMLLIRMQYPDINGGEKFMDHAFFASIMRVPIVPPLDPWFARETLEVYYYLGHWCFAILGIIAHIPSWILFQLVLPTVAAISAVQLYSIGKLLLKKLSLLPVLCLFIVNPAFIYGFISGTSAFSLLWDSSRVITDAINEYPLFTFIFGDVHAHAIGFFNQTFFILLVVYLFTQWQNLQNKERMVCTILTGISLGTMPGMNSWDALIYGLLFVFAAIFIWYQACNAERSKELSGVSTGIFTWCTHLYADISRIWRERTEMSGSSAAICYLWIFTPIIALLSYAPFLLMMRTEGAKGIGFVYTSTTLTEFLLVFGWFLLLLLCTLYGEIKKRPELLVVAVPFILTGYPVLGLILMLLAYLIARRKGVADLLAGCGLLLALLCELIYMKDALGSDWYRMNTVFKLYLPAWFLIGVGSICSASMHAEQLMNRLYYNEKQVMFEKIITGFVMSITLLIILATPLITYGTIGGFGDHRPTLDGSAWMEIYHPDDYAAIIYLRELPGNYTLVEAEGSSYQYIGRFSSGTGIPTILGWGGHESTWRGDNPRGWYGERTMDISKIYEQPDKASEIMAKYNANLLIVGASERERYQIPTDTDAYLPDLLPVFTAGETTIYQRLQK